MVSNNYYNNKRYVGILSDNDERYFPKGNKRLQDDIAKYGINAFHVMILGENMSDKDAEFRASKFKKYFKTETEGYNKKEVGKQGINQYDLDGNFIDAFKSIREASEATGIGESNISKALLRKGIAGDYRWGK
jgi:hypothetical protein